MVLSGGGTTCLSRLPLQVQQFGDRWKGPRHHRHLLGFIHHHWSDPNDGLAQAAQQWKQHLPAWPDEVRVWEGGGHGVYGLLQLLCLCTDPPAADAGHLPVHLHGGSPPAQADRVEGGSRGEVPFCAAERGPRCQVSGHHSRAVRTVLAAFAHNQLLHPFLS